MKLIWNTYFHIDLDILLILFVFLTLRCLAAKSVTIVKCYPTA
jgi:hypothetical protein